MVIEWSEWESLDHLPDHRGHAVYRIRLLESGKVISIQRFLGCDNEGILCIGKSNNLKSRLAQFRRGKDNGREHYEAYRLYTSRERLNELFPSRTYEYSFVKLEPGKEGDLEAELLKEYCREFGEVPPLNSNLPKMNQRGQ